MVRENQILGNNPPTTVNAENISVKDKTPGNNVGENGDTKNGNTQIATEGIHSPSAKKSIKNTPRNEGTRSNASGNSHVDDYNVGSFSKNPPWTIKIEDLKWREDVNRIRENAIDELPKLIERSTLPPLNRGVSVISSLSSAIVPWYLLERKKNESKYKLSRRLKNSFHSLGPTYIKLGQILSSGDGIFPDEVVNEFKLLRDKVPAESFDKVKATIESDFNLPLEAVFKTFDTTPIAAASIAQVHKATLRTGEEVVVKVQRPKIGRLVRQDLSVMSWIAPFLVGRIPISSLANPPALVELFAKTIIEELDFRLEADNMLEVAKVLADSGQRSIIVPRPHPKWVTKRVLVMERLDGFKWDDVESMRDAGVNTENVLRAGMISLLEGTMLYGIFHGDLHGGNLFVQEDGTVALLDFGITGRLSPEKRQAFLKLIISAMANQIPEQVEALRDLGALPPDIIVEQVIVDLGFDQPAIDPIDLTAEEIIGEIQKLVKGLLAYGAKLPKELMLFAKNMLFMDTAVGKFAPNIDILGEISEIAAYFTDKHADKIKEDVGFDPREVPIDLEGIKGAMGLKNDVESITYKDLQNRREILKKRLEGVEIPKKGFSKG